MKKILILFASVALFFQCDNSSSGEKLFGKSYVLDDVNETVVESTNRLASPPSRKESFPKKFIKNGRLRFETDDLSKTKIFIQDLVKASDGYISSDNSSQSGNRNYNYLMVRIPENQFDVFMNKLSGKVDKFETKEITIDDVTERFYDLQIRLKTKKELEKKYLDILQKAKTVKEILEVEREINKLREEIESTEGKFKYLSNQVSYATLNIQFYESVGVDSSFGNDIGESLKNGLDYIRSFFLTVLSLWPFIILVGIVGFILKRIKRKK